MRNACVKVPLPPAVTARTGDGLGPNLGVVVLNHALVCLLTNPQADRLIRLLHESDPNHQAMSLLPKNLGEACRQLVMLLKKHPDPRSWGRVQLTRVIGGPVAPVFVRLHGIPAPAHQPEEYHLLMLLERISHEGRTTDVGEASANGLSQREQACLGLLAEGLTNKEIADRLGLSEHTIKEYFKRIMQKSGAKTRTGALAWYLARVQHASLPSPAPRVNGTAFVS